MATRPGEAPAVVPFPGVLSKAPGPANRFHRADARYWQQPGKLTKPGRSVSWCARIQHAGRRELLVLDTSNKGAAAVHAAGLYRRIAAEGWDPVLAELRPAASPSRSSTIASVIAALHDVDLRPRTRTNYSAALRWWGARLLEMRPGRKEFSRDNTGWRARIDGLGLDRFTPAALNTVRDHFVATNAKHGAEQERRSRVSVKSYARNAKGALRATRDRVSMPDPPPFAGFKVERAVTRTFRPEADAGSLLRAAHAQPDAGVFLVVALALGAGLRRAELEHLVWRNVDRSSSKVWVEAVGGWHPKTDGSAAGVHVDAGLIDALERWRGADDARVVPNGAPTRTVAWLRAQGITARCPIHHLRKLFGSEIFARADLLVASRQLRHSSLAVTSGVYVAVKDAIAPPVGDWLNPGGAA